MPYLRGQGLKKLDGFMIGHDDIDHSGDGSSVLLQIPVDWVASSFEITEINEIQKRISCFKMPILAIRWR